MTISDIRSKARETLGFYDYFIFLMDLEDINFFPCNKEEEEDVQRKLKILAARYGLEGD